MGAEVQGELLGAGVTEEVRRPLRPLWRLLAEICLCSVCSCQEILRRNGRASWRRPCCTRRHPWRVATHRPSGASCAGEPGTQPKIA
jgi:hypothetical protein